MPEAGIVHIGAPKCGSSALQRALSVAPLLHDGARHVRYVALRAERGWTRLEGEALRRAAQGSPFGYVSCPDPARVQDGAGLMRAVAATLCAGAKRGVRPILSCEGWIAHPDAFAAALRARGFPPVEAVAFLRPPVDWVNAAYWQWGVWGAPTAAAWLAGGTMPYRFGALLTRWARIPNLSLRVRPARPDAVARFAADFGLPLVGGGCNAASPAALLGFLLRNRRFRPSAHASQAEFVVQRWCPPVPGRLWALRAEDVRALRPVVAETREMLCRLLPAEDLDILMADPRWTREEPYHRAILSGISVLDDPQDLPHLHMALAEGLCAACAAAGRPVPDLPAAPSQSAPLAQWDRALAAQMAALLEADRIVRCRVAARAQPPLRRVLAAFGWQGPAVKRLDIGRPLGNQLRIKP
ncbi:hypothetical protein C8N32_1219 [Rhodovulum imhoffii]|uniref:Sulfotransferase family protein n=1 Tax=Rhodovulum imhoffii TaxID=365340 RepID=A0A2T5BPF6_9RHOB|nr:hypothetical protein [Rhodovulum imhoffii]MBK5932908.1 hypothetical protein [Rhodovulum imhoffii]PTN00844.1 hypothetical protein C8N32_1219 [Rhodovulum imhoffii]